jgi:plasmid rolling circle replication initiator protein Rep
LVRLGQLCAVRICWLMDSRTGRQIALAELLETCKTAWVADIFRAIKFLEQAEEVRTGCRKQRTRSRTRQSQGAKTKAAKLDQPLNW